MRKWALLIVVSSLAVGCAFKESGEIAGMDQEQMNSLDGNIKNLALSWGEGERKITLGKTDLTRRDRTAWTRELPVTLPADVPERLTLSVAFKQDPQSLGAIRIEAKAVNGDGLESQEIGTADLKVVSEGAGARLTVDLVGLQMLLSKEFEQRIYLDLKFLQAGTPLYQFRIAATTPPSNWKVLRRDVRDKTGQMEDSSSRLPITLHSQALSLNLIERVVFKNQSPGSVEMNLPFKIESKVLAKLRKHWPKLVEQSNPHIKVHEQVEQEQVEEVAAEVFVVPSLENIEQVWPSLASDSHRRMIVDSGEEVEVGLYAPEMINESLKPLRVQAPKKVQAQVDGRAHCPYRIESRIPESRLGDEGRWWCDLMRKVGYPLSDDGINACNESIRTMRECVNSGWSRLPCNRAALAADWVDRTRSPHPDNKIPWPSWAACARYDMTSDNHIKYIHVLWEWEPVFGLFKEGFSWLGAALKLKPEEGVLGQLRFRTGNPEADQEARNLKLFGNELRLEGN